MSWLTEPFEVTFMQRALLAGLLVAVLCACVGTWVVRRGLAFLGEALGHGLLPGVAVAHLAGFSLLIGATASAAVMVAGVTYASRRANLSADTGIGLLFVGMLAVGVIIVSRERSFAVDLTGFLFGDVLGASTSGNRWLALTVLVAIAASVLLYRPFVALCFDERKARTLGFRPGLANAAMLALVTLAVVSSYRVVGTLLVFGFLVAPPATAALLVRRIPLAMVVAALLGSLSVVIGLLVSWHADTAAGATIAGCAVAQFFVVLIGRDLMRLLHIGEARRIAAA